MRTRAARAAALTVSDPKIKRQTRRARKDAEATPQGEDLKAHTHPDPPCDGKTGPTLEDQLAMSRSETATARRKVEDLEALAAKQATVIEELTTAKAPERETIVAMMVRQGAAIGIDQFIPGLVRKMREGDLIEITHEGDKLSIALKRSPKDEEGSSLFDFVTSLVRRD